MKKLISNLLLITVLSVVTSLAGAEETKGVNQDDPNLRQKIDGEYNQYTADKSNPDIARMYKQAPQEKDACVDCYKNGSDIRDNTTAAPASGGGTPATKQKGDK